MILRNGCVIFKLIIFISTVESIYNGYNATQDQFPYQAHINVYRSDHKSINNCSGAVITSLFVITSYDCVSGGESFRIILGSLNPGEVDDKPAYDHVTEIIFRKESRLNSARIALLQVEVEISFNDHVKPVTLPDPDGPNLNDTYAEFATASSNYATATGYYSEGPEHLQYLTMKVVSISECNRRYINIAFNFQLCARGEDINANVRGSLCKEKGVPLVLNKDRKTLIGILQEIDGASCENGAPSIFIDVSRFVDWINKTVNGTTSSLSV